MNGLQNGLFAIGTRVRISGSWFVASIRAAIGRVADPGFVITPGCLWVEFDEPLPGDDPAHPTEAAEVDVQFLEAL